MKAASRSILAIHDEIDRAVKDLAFFGRRYQAFHPSAGGDVSQIFSENVSDLLVRRFGKTSSRWFSIETIEELAKIRKDGRSGYRGEGVQDPKFYELIKPIARRVLLITCTGSQIPAILETLRWTESGKLINLVEVSKDGKQIRI